MIWETLTNRFAVSRFTDESHLSKFFKKYKGCSPSSFRKSNNILETDVSCYLPEKRNP